MSRVAKALLQHPACSVLLLSFGLMVSLVGVHESKRKTQKTVDVFSLAMTLSALPYSAGCTSTSQEGSPTMMMKALPCSLGCTPTSQEGSPTMMMKAPSLDSGLCSNAFSNLSLGYKSEFGLKVLPTLCVAVFTENLWQPCGMKCTYENVMTDFCKNSGEHS